MRSWHRAPPIYLADPYYWPGGTQGRRLANSLYPTSLTLASDLEGHIEVGEDPVENLLAVGVDVAVMKRVEDPVGPGRGVGKVWRGSLWMMSGTAGARLSNRECMVHQSLKNDPSLDVRFH